MLSVGKIRHAAEQARQFVEHDVRFRHGCGDGVFVRRRAQRARRDERGGGVLTPPERIPVADIHHLIHSGSSLGIVRSPRRASAALGRDSARSHRPKELHPVRSSGSGGSDRKPSSLPNNDSCWASALPEATRPTGRLGYSLSCSGAVQIKPINRRFGDAFAAIATVPLPMYGSMIIGFAGQTDSSSSTKPTGKTQPCLGCETA